MDFINFLYSYCTDFTINLANLLGYSYYEINAFIFVFLYPFLIVFIVILIFFESITLRFLKVKKNKLLKNKRSYNKNY
jgi:hypothetical protein